MPDDVQPEDNTPKPNLKPSVKPSVKSVGGAAIEHGKKAVQAVDKASSAAESASHALGAIKWTAIAIVTIIFAGGAYGIYKAVSAPVKAVGNASEAVTDTVKSSAERLKQGKVDVANRLIIPTRKTAKFNRLSEAAFAAVTNMASTEPTNLKERIFRTKNFIGNAGRICAFNFDFGNGELPVTIAADNDAYASSKALGSKTNRMMRMIIEAGRDDLSLSAVWDDAAQGWALKWKATTLKKTVNDKVAEQRALDVLAAASQSCK